MVASVPLKLAIRAILVMSIPASKDSFKSNDLFSIIRYVIPVLL
nr:MAG TPA: hypothetical protein [Bacteriophage sp.]